MTAATLFGHAMRLHRLHPDEPLPRDGYPFPDDDLHSGRRLPASDDHRRAGAAVAVILDAHFARPHAPPSALNGAFHDVYVPIHRNEHIVAAALRADADRVRQAGRWLVRHGTDRCSATVGLALLATGWDAEDIPLIQTIGLLSNHFGPLAVDALARRPRNGSQTLLWLAQRVAGWGRVYVVEALCRYGVDDDQRHWLLRHACDGDYLNSYFAERLATVGHLYEAITSAAVDDELIAHTGRLLLAMADAGGMGATLESYPPAAAVLARHAELFGGLAPTAQRYLTVALLADRLERRPPEKSGCDDEGRDRLVLEYLAVLNRPEWCAVIHDDRETHPEFLEWFVPEVAMRLGLRAFSR
ncbi:hypothetical protein ACFY36_07120 [Actinoplanes sp. NPDC000266]